MSVVATKIYEDRVEIGSDSILVHGWTQCKDRQVKLFQSELGVAVGGCGTAEEMALLKIFLKTTRPREASEDGITSFIHEFHEWLEDHGNGKPEDPNSYHIVYDGKAFLVSGYYIAEIKDYHAIGAGMDYALTALYLGSTVEEAIGAACELSIFCERPINLISVPR